MPIGIGAGRIAIDTASATTNAPLLWQDTFTDSNGTLLTAHVPTSNPLGLSWGVSFRGLGSGSDPDAPEFRIQSNTAQLEVATDSSNPLLTTLQVALAWLDMGAEVAAIEADITWPANTANRQTGLFLGTGLNTHWVVRYLSSVPRFTITQYDNEVITDRVLIQQAAPNATDTMRLEFDGVTVTLKLNGSTLGTYSSATYAGGTYCGLWALSFDATSKPLWDNVRVELA